MVDHYWKKVSQVDGISVIVCCHNSANRISNALECLAGQQTVNLPWEVIVVDNASTDNTKTVATECWVVLGRHDVPLRVVDEAKPGLTYARQKGIEAAAYEGLIFCDDDNLLSDQYIQTAFDLLRRYPKVGAIGGWGQARTEKTIPTWFANHASCYACFPQGTEDGPLAPSAALYGAGLVLRKEVLRDLDDAGFKPVMSDRKGKSLLSGGDSELSYAIQLRGYLLWYCAALRFYHVIPASRLTEKYLTNLVGALAYSSGQLMCYQYALRNSPVTKLTWIKDTLYQFGFLIRSVTLPKSNELSELDRKLDLTFARNRAVSIFRQFGSYKKKYNRVARLKLN